MRVPFIQTGKENRYLRQESVLGKVGQKKLQKSKVAIVGIGALGGTVAEILVRSGVGSTTLIDGDVIEYINLHRQFLFDEDDVGHAKADVAAKTLRRANTDVKIMSEVTEITHKNIDELLRRKELVIDCTDNNAARMLLNDYCRHKKLPWISGKARGTAGRVMLFSHDKESPCYRCAHDNEQMEESGVLSTITTLVGSLQAIIALRQLQGLKIDGLLRVIDAEQMNISKIDVKQKSDCVVCKNRRFEYLEGKGYGETDRGDSYHYMRKGQYNTLKKRLERKGKIDDYGTHFTYNNMTFFRDGRMIIRADSKDEAKALFNKFG